MPSAAQLEASIPRPHSSSSRPSAPAPILPKRRLSRLSIKPLRTCTTYLTRSVSFTKVEWSTTVQLHLLADISSNWGTDRPVDRPPRISLLQSLTPTPGSLVNDTSIVYQEPLMNLRGVTICPVSGGSTRRIWLLTSKNLSETRNTPWRIGTPRGQNTPRPPRRRVPMSPQFRCKRRRSCSEGYRSSKATRRLKSLIPSHFWSKLSWSERCSSRFRIRQLLYFQGGVSFTCSSLLLFKL